MSAEVLLEVRDLVKDFGGLRAVNKCSLSVRRGTITGLIGPNGAGKTTLFNLITGFYKPDSGQVIFRGEDITGLPPHKVFHKGLCRTFQIPREFKQMTVLENLMVVPAGQRGENIFYPWFMPRLVRRQEAEIREKALRILKFMNLLDLRDEYAGNLSGAQKKLLELARALMGDPEMILLDEPSAGVNPTMVQGLVEYIRRLVREKGVTVFLIAHDMDLVMNLCSPVIVMCNGEKLAEGTPQEIQRDERVLEAYLGSQYQALARG
jgi:branched-chain amino acid transport system ATP-binding protein